MKEEKTMSSSLAIHTIETAALRAFPDFDDHETVFRIEDTALNVVAFIGIHDRTLGHTALGGCRFLNYLSEEAAVEDVLRLSRGMTYKSALAGVPNGGGKAVIMAPHDMDPRDKDDPRRKDVFRFFGKAVSMLDGAYATGEDMNVSPMDLEEAVLGVRELGGDERLILGTHQKSGNPGSFTALGVYLGIQALLREEPLCRHTIAIQGLGNVGMPLAYMCHNAGAKVIACDPMPERCAKAQSELDARIVAIDAIYDQECTVFAPCAGGGVINDNTISRLRCFLIAGSANNQLEADHHGKMLDERNVLYAPDFVINAGGLLNVATELDPGGYSLEGVHQRLPIIVHNLQTIKEQYSSFLPSGAIAVMLAKERLRAARTSIS